MSNVSKLYSQNYLYYVLSLFGGKQGSEQDKMAMNSLLIAHISELPNRILRTGHLFVLHKVKTDMGAYKQSYGQN